MGFYYQPKPRSGLHKLLIACGAAALVQSYLTGMKAGPTAAAGGRPPVKATSVGPFQQPAFGSEPVPSGCGDRLAPIRAALREQESGGNYKALNPNAQSGASGAYQFINSTWGGYGGYRRAMDAPPAVQDAKANEHITEALGGTDDVTRVPYVWFIGHLPVGNEADVVPAPWAGNTHTPRQYADQWMARYRRFAAQCQAGA